MFSIRRSLHLTFHRRVSLVVASLAFGVLMALGTSAMAATFNPAKVCSDGTLRVM